MKHYRKVEGEGESGRRRIIGQAVGLGSLVFGLLVLDHELNRSRPKDLRPKAQDPRPGPFQMINHSTYSSLSVVPFFSLSSSPPRRLIANIQGQRGIHNDQ
jgi:hypothetical protein